MTQVPIYFGDCHEHDLRRRQKPDYVNCAIRVKRLDTDPNEAPHRIQIDLVASSRTDEPIKDVNITLYAVGGHLLFEKEDEDLSSVVLRGIISESIPIQRWMHQTIHRSTGDHPGWRPRRPVEWGTLSDPKKGYIIVATLDIPERGGRPRIQATELNPARDLLVAVYCSYHAEHAGPERCS